MADQNLIRVIDAQNNVSTLLGTGIPGNFDEILDIDVAPGAAGSLYFTTKYNTLYKIDGSNNTLEILTEGEGNDDGPLSDNGHLQGAYGIASGINGDIALFNSYRTAMKRIRATGAGAGTVEAWAGKPTNEALGGSWPFSDGQGNIYLADKDNARLRKISPSGAVSSILPYVDGDGAHRQLWE